MEETPKKRWLSPSDKYCEEHFKATCRRRSDGRYIVSLPFKPEFPQNLQLGHSRSAVLRQFLRGEQSLLRNPEIKTVYDNVIREYLDLHHMRPVERSLVSGSGTCYLPHHPVINPEKKTTKLRVVFNASHKTTNGVSLNDLLYIGPTLQADLLLLILKWRLYRYVFNCDITQMYRQILVDPAHTAFQRILFRDSPSQDVQDFELLTVTFGVNCAPYLAIRVLLQLADDCESKYPLAANILRKNMYVDDVLTGTHDLNLALRSRDQLIDCLATAGFVLRKWTANEKQILERFSREELVDEQLLAFVESSGSKPLGILWNAHLDAFYFNVEPIKDTSSHTKRTVLSIIARLFDPIGWLAPVIIVAKIIMQRLWLDQIEWDDPLPSATEVAWKSFIETYHEVNAIQIPRWIGYTPACIAELHVFSDASEKAYAGVIYLRIETPDGKVKISMQCSKTRVAPVKSVSLPRLELCGAVVASELLKTTLSEIGIPLRRVYCWTDSTIVLSWLKKPPCTWSTFVANRVCRIQENVGNHNWYHVKSEDNPADLGSRGVTPAALTESNLWWHGPHWLTLNNSQWPIQEVETRDTELEKRAVKSHFSFFEKYEDILERFSSLDRALRVIANIFCFYERTHPAHKARYVFRGIAISNDEVVAVRQRLALLAQKKHFALEYKCLTDRTPLPSNSSLITLNPMLDDNGIMRLNGRLARSPTLRYSEKHPILLPNNCRLFRLLVEFIHLISIHGGNQLMLRLLRMEYWVPRIKTMVRAVVRNCKTCIIDRKQTAGQIMAALPPERTTLDRPFSNTGVDFAGPLDIKLGVGRSVKIGKGYVCVFVCFSTKAIHLEATSELTTEAFLAGFQRFVARRGCPNTIFSDNGTNFVGASRELAREFKGVLQESRLRIDHSGSHPGITWRFIPAGSPHMGGLWEAAVKSFKMHFRKHAQSSKYTFEELSTLLARIEACLNSRPLCPMSDNPQDIIALTPGHFLIGAPLLAPPESRVPDHPLGLVNRFRKMRALDQQMCVRWKEDYLHQLQIRYKWKHPHRDVRVNDLVVVKNEQLPPTSWKLGRVIRVCPGTDNHVRVADIRTENGITYRGWQFAKIVLLFKIINHELNTLVTWRYHPGLTTDFMFNLEKKLSQYYIDLAKIFKDYPFMEQEFWLTSFYLSPTHHSYEAVKRMGIRFNRRRQDEPSRWNITCFENNDAKYGLLSSTIDVKDIVVLTNAEDQMSEYTPLIKALKSLHLPNSFIKDMLTVIFLPRNGSFSWAVDWNDLRRRCKMFMNSPQEKKRFIELTMAEANDRLKYLNIDYAKYKNRPQLDYGSIERGYENVTGDLDTHSDESEEEEDDFEDDEDAYESQKPNNKGGRKHEDVEVNEDDNSQDDDPYLVGKRRTRARTAAAMATLLSSSEITTRRKRRLLEEEMRVKEEKLIDEEKSYDSKSNDATTNVPETSASVLRMPCVGGESPLSSTSEIQKRNFKECLRERPLIISAKTDCFRPFIDVWEVEKKELETIEDGVCVSLFEASRIYNILLMHKEHKPTIGNELNHVVSEVEMISQEDIVSQQIEIVKEEKEGEAEFKETGCNVNNGKENDKKKEQNKEELLETTADKQMQIEDEAISEKMEDNVKLENKKETLKGTLDTSEEDYRMDVDEDFNSISESEKLEFKISKKDLIRTLVEPDKENPKDPVPLTISESQENLQETQDNIQNPVKITQEMTENKEIQWHTLSSNKDFEKLEKHQKCFQGTKESEYTLNVDDIQDLADIVVNSSETSLIEPEENKKNFVETPDSVNATLAAPSTLTKNENQSTIEPIIVTEEQFEIDVIPNNPTTIQNEQEKNKTNNDETPDSVNAPDTSSFTANQNLLIIEPTDVAEENSPKKIDSLVETYKPLVENLISSNTEGEKSQFQDTNIKNLSQNVENIEEPMEEGLALKSSEELHDVKQPLETNFRCGKNILNVNAAADPKIQIVSDIEVEMVQDDKLSNKHRIDIVTSSAFIETKTVTSAGANELDIPTLDPLGKEIIVLNSADNCYKQPEEAKDSKNKSYDLVEKVNSTTISAAMDNLSTNHEDLILYDEEKYNLKEIKIKNDEKVNVPKNHELCLKIKDKDNAEKEIQKTEKIFKFSEESDQKEYADETYNTHLETQKNTTPNKEKSSETKTEIQTYESDDVNSKIGDLETEDDCKIDLSTKEQTYDSDDVNSKIGDLETEDDSKIDLSAKETEAKQDPPIVTDITFFENMPTEETENTDNKKCIAENFYTDTSTNENSTKQDSPIVADVNIVASMPAEETDNSDNIKCIEEDFKTNISTKEIVEKQNSPTVADVTIEENMPALQWDDTTLCIDDDNVNQSQAAKLEDMPCLESEGINKDMSFLDSDSYDSRSSEKEKQYNIKPLRVLVARLRASDLVNLRQPKVRVKRIRHSPETTMEELPTKRKRIKKRFYSDIEESSDSQMSNYSNSWMYRPLVHNSKNVARRSKKFSHLAQRNSDTDCDSQKSQTKVRKRRLEKTNSNNSTNSSSRCSTASSGILVVTPRSASGLKLRISHAQQKPSTSRQKSVEPVDADVIIQVSSSSNGDESNTMDSILEVPEDNETDPLYEEAVIDLRRRR